jgi:hypothetical protein
VQNLSRLENLAEQKHIDLYYGDESGVSLLPCIPYGWLTLPRFGVRAVKQEPTRRSRL